MKLRKVFLVAGARPNFMKIAPLWRDFQKHADVLDTRIIHTGQHYDGKMSDVFFSQLGLPEPHYNLGVGSGTHGKQTADILAKVEEVILADKPDLLIVVGDVNSTIAAALAAVKCGVKVAHIEAGLRSFDMSMPEEINRILTDRISDYLFVSEPSGLENLRNEGTDMRKVHHVGNVMIDTLAYHLDHIKSLNICSKYKLTNANFAVITLHRPANVDNAKSLGILIEIVNDLSKRMPVVFPMHPRTRHKVNEYGLADLIHNDGHVVVTEPLGYFEFMSLVTDAKLVLTDSGGIQEETTWLGISCITLRESTERPLTITHGTNQLATLSKQEVNKALDRALTLDKHAYQPPVLWDGAAAKRIADVLLT